MIDSSITIAITGANGFLGRHTIQNAIQRGYTVRAIIRRDEAVEIVEDLGAQAYVLPSLENEELNSIFTGFGAVLNFLGIVSPQQGDFEKINVGNAQIILKTALECGVNRVIIPTGLGVDQYNQKEWATNAYFLSKLHIEQECQQASQPFVLFRPSTIMGPGDEITPSLVRSIQKGIVSIIGDGNAPMQPISVFDATNAFLNAALGMGDNNMIYDLVGPEILNMNQLVTKILLIMKQEGFPKSRIKIENINPLKAKEKLGLSQEEVDITLCDVIGDNASLLSNLDLTLSPIDDALRAAVVEVKKEWKEL